ncbi:tripartite tricarboxylate transporter substrate binding protein [Achromobacter aloeverae]|uniref:Tripartite tricarboxylate transporter substrate binding protein n=1 Tax=Achromobacter aloeverae TaxID=1750518 RepID=A0A4Q1HMJ2_9BURK|nr:tripartite tricarboxylate transporter substrate binding protein [Achromobacter aloeverae]RXN91410.1 tripartite tricarboxylate transporter substrate binding protein [Achromobacter aloeverae]
MKFPLPRPHQGRPAGRPIGVAAIVQGVRQGCAAAALALTALAGSPTTVHAADAYPAYPVHIVVPYQAGGSTDIVIRKFAELAAPKLGQPIIIENRGGAGATLGARAIKTARPDGYMLAILPSPVFRMPHIQDMGYDPVHDFTYIMMLSGYTLGVAVPADSPYKTWADFIGYAKKHPNEVTYGTASVGSASNVMMEDIATRNGVTWRHIPYKGEADVLTAVMGGQITAYAGSTTVQPMVQAGKMRMLVTWGDQRSVQYPDTPTLKELDGTPPANAPFGIAGPKDMPPAVVAKLQAVLKQVAETDAFKQVLAQYGQELVYMDGKAYADYAARQYALEADIVRKLGLASSK